MKGRMYAPPRTTVSVKLSDNDNFCAPVNQRGVTSATGIMPLIDRWVNYYATSIVCASGIEISATAMEQGIFQILDNPSLEGKPVTCACKYADGTLICVSGIVPPVQAYNQRFATTKGENKGKAVVPAVQLLANTGYIQILLFSVCGGSDTICWAALYEGEYTADALPPYIPRPYSVELAECQRYYRPFVKTAPAITVAAHAIAAQMVLDPPMRAGCVPTVTINSVGDAYTHDGMRTISTSYSDVNDEHRVGYVFYSAESVTVGTPAIITGISGFVSSEP